MFDAVRNTIEVNRAGGHTAEDRKQAMMVSAVCIELVPKKDEDDIPNHTGVGERVFAPKCKK